MDRLKLSVRHTVRHFSQLSQKPPSNVSTSVCEFSSTRLRSHKKVYVQANRQNWWHAYCRDNFMNMYWWMPYKLFAVRNITTSFRISWAKIWLGHECVNTYSSRRSSFLIENSSAPAIYYIGWATILHRSDSHHKYWCHCFLGLPNAFTNTLWGTLLASMPWIPIAPDTRQQYETGLSQPHSGKQFWT